MSRTLRMAVPLIALLAVAAVAAWLLGYPIVAQDQSQGDQQVPDVPTGLAVSATHGAATLTWNDPGDASITHYEVYRRDRDLDASGVFQLIESNTGSAAATWVDATVVPESRYVYRVKAVNAQGASPRWSSFANVDIPPAPAEEDESESKDEGPDAKQIVNQPATGRILIIANGRPVVGQTLRALPSGLADADGLTNASYSYQWLADGEPIAGANSLTYQLTDAETGKLISFRVTFSDDANNLETLTSGTTLAVTTPEVEPDPDAPPPRPAGNRPATGAVAFSELPVVGDLLTVDPDIFPTIDDPDGLTNPSFATQWLVDGAAIEGATGNTFLITDDLLGKTIQLRVLFRDDAGYLETLTSPATRPVWRNSPARGAPVIRGVPQVGRTLTVDTSGITDPDGFSPVIPFEFSWWSGQGGLRGTGTSYNVSEADLGETITVAAHFSDGREYQEVLTSAPTLPVTRNARPTGSPAILGTAQVGETLFALTHGIDDADGLSNPSFSYQWLADGAPIAGQTASLLALTRAELGKTIQVRVSFNDDTDNRETLTSAPTLPVKAALRDLVDVDALATVEPVGALVGNLGRSPQSTVEIFDQYAAEFRLGRHGQGYAISSVVIDLAQAPSTLTVSLWISAPRGLTSGSGQPQRKLFDFINPTSLRAGLNRFTAPAGAFAYQNVEYWVVLSDFGLPLVIHETTSDQEDPGGEPGAVIGNAARLRALGSSGPWEPGSYRSRNGVLRFAVEGSKRERGILVSRFAQPNRNQETISVSDECCFKVTVGSADRYLIRGFSLAADNTTSLAGFHGLPFRLTEDKDDDKDMDAKTFFSLRHTTAQGGELPLGLASPAGISEWAAPRGSTVAGGTAYRLRMTVESIEGDDEESTRGGIVNSRIFCQQSGASAEYDAPSDPGWVLNDLGDVDCDHPSAAVHGEPLDAMVSNLGQDPSDEVIFTASLEGSTKTLSQGFHTGASAHGYRMQGVGFALGQSVPEGPTSVSLSLHADADGKPGAKLFDLVPPDKLAQNTFNFFEAPPEATLEPDTDYVLVWRRLGSANHQFSSTIRDGEDSGGLSGFTIADLYSRGSTINNLSATASGWAVELAVYGEALDGPAPTAPPAPPDGQATLVSNLGQQQRGTGEITGQYAMGFTLGDHGQGYAISSVLIDLDRAPSNLTVSLWISGPPWYVNSARIQEKLFDFTNPAGLRAGLNRFTAPEGAFAYPNVNYYVVLSGFDSSLWIRETASDAEERGGAAGAGAVLANTAQVRALGSSGYWRSFSERSDVLRLAVEGSRRDRGILASRFPPHSLTLLEVMSADDDCCFDLEVGAADRYLIRRVSLVGDDTTIANGFFGLPLWLRRGSTTFVRLGNTRQIAGVNEWTAPQGSTVAGNRSYSLDMFLTADSNLLIGGVFASRAYCADASEGERTDFNRPSAPGVSFSSRLGDCTYPAASVDGEALHAMVSNLVQADDGHFNLQSSSPRAIAQGFRSGSSTSGYRLQGIGVNIEGGASSVPDGPSSVSAAVHADAGGAPGEKLFELISPDVYAAGHSFFEAPPDTVLSPDTDYVLVWRHLGGTAHRLRATSSADQDAGGLLGFSLADHAYLGADLSSLAINAKALEIAVYGEVRSAQEVAAATVVFPLAAANTGQRSRSTPALDDSTTARAQQFVTPKIAGGLVLGSVGVWFDRIASPPRRRRNWR